MTLLERSKDLDYVDGLIEEYSKHFNVEKKSYFKPAENLAYGIDPMKHTMTIEQAKDLICIALSDRAKEVDGHTICDVVFECLAVTYGGTEVVELIKASDMVAKWYA